MKLIKIAAAAALAGLVAMPTQAWALFCSSEGPIAGYETRYEDGERVLVIDTDAQEDLDLLRLRQIGVPASSVERWNGCLRAFVTAADGSQSMEFYDPASLRRLQ